MPTQSRGHGTQRSKGDVKSGRGAGPMMQRMTRGHGQAALGYEEIESELLAADDPLNRVAALIDEHNQVAAPATDKIAWAVVDAPNPGWR